MHIINYFIRGLIFLLGFLMLFRVGIFNQKDELLTTGLGIIFILFGALRLITYFQATKKNQRINIEELTQQNKDDDDDDDKE